MRHEEERSGGRFSYVLDFDKQGKTEFDVAYENHGVTILVDKKSYLFLNGTAIDWEEQKFGHAFTYTNPNATGICGCGTPEFDCAWSFAEDFESYATGVTPSDWNCGTSRMIGRS